MSKVSVIIAVWNGENYLEKAIENVLKQDDPNKELIVVNDGSTDLTAQIIQKWSPYIISIEQKNQGLGSARNRGIQAATGEFLAFLDHDDLWHEKKLSTQRKTWEKSLDDPLIFSHMKQFFCPTLKEDERKKISMHSDETPGYFAGTLWISKQRFTQVGNFTEQNILGDFIEWYLRAKEQHIPIHLMEETLYYRRIHQNNMGRKNQNRRSDYLKIFKEHLTRKREILTALQDV